MNSTIISTPFCNAPGTPAVARAAARPKSNMNNHAKADRPNHRVDVDRPEAHRASLVHRMCKCPGSVRKLTIGQIGQMVLDVLVGRQCFAGHRTSFTSALSSSTAASTGTPRSASAIIVAKNATGSGRKYANATTSNPIDSNSFAIMLPIRRRAEFNSCPTGALAFATRHANPTFGAITTTPANNADTACARPINRNIIASAAAKTPWTARIRKANGTLRSMILMRAPKSDSSVLPGPATNRSEPPSARRA